MSSEYYNKDVKLHSEDRPALVYYREDRSMIASYIIRYVKHPEISYIKYRNTSFLTTMPLVIIHHHDDSETTSNINFHFDKVVHRVDGPAEIMYDENGNVIREFYVINGEFLSKEDWEQHSLRQGYLLSLAIEEELYE